jgi:hypothetical protein
MPAACQPALAAFKGWPYFLANHANIHKQGSAPQENSLRQSRALLLVGQEACKLLFTTVLGPSSGCSRIIA